MLPQPGQLSTCPLNVSTSQALIVTIVGHKYPIDVTICRMGVFEHSWPSQVISRSKCFELGGHIVFRTPLVCPPLSISSTCIFMSDPYVSQGITTCSLNTTQAVSPTRLSSVALLHISQLLRIRGNRSILQCFD
jgi:hypothetical protein